MVFFSVQVWETHTIHIGEMLGSIGCHASVDDCAEILVAV